MKLNDEEQDILAGKFGPLPQQALAHQKSGRRVLRRRGLRAGDAGAHHGRHRKPRRGRRASGWRSSARSPKGQRQVRMPTITDPRGTDFAKAATLGQTQAMLDLERRAIDAFVKLGVTMTDTCINYQTMQAPIAMSTSPTATPAW